jgi:pyrroline-5-carboxylate reductase
MGCMCTISVIGAGVMGEAIIAGLLKTSVTPPASIFASDPRHEREQELFTKYGVGLQPDNLTAVSKTDGAVILAIKPQQLHKVMSGLHGKIPPSVLVISIIAGASIKTISEGLAHDSIVRAMPNTPAQIGEGVTVWHASPAVTDKQLDLTRQILGALGTEILMDEERYLDMATALSGTGPAYVFLFLEALIDAGVHLGFPRHIARQLVLETVHGSLDYNTYRQSHPAQLRNEVTSPGGTSAEALYYLEKAGFRTAISRAIWAAYERSQELGMGMNGQDPEKKHG